ncbi:UCH-domain-containing protein [Hypoxylon sp. FL0543]|nr:UCH-domain-containing protein [Hypoxylon sp. FL0543]
MNTPEQTTIIRSFVCSRQLAVKTSSSKSKKRKISTRHSAAAAADESLSRNSSPDTPIQSCEQDTDPSFSFASSDNLATGSPAYYAADSILPASSLPPRLQTNTNSFSYADYASSAASSPSGAYAELTINSDRGGDTPAPDHTSTASNLYPPGRASSPFTKTTLHRAVMGGAAEFPERASSPLKRRASSMDPDAADRDAAEDVDMITAPTSDSLDTSKPEQSCETIGANPAPTVDGQGTATNEEAGQSMDISPAHQPPTPIDKVAHVKAILALVEEQNTQPLKEGQQCFLVSKSWLAQVPDITSPKISIEDLSSIPPIDNSDLVLEVIDDPCVGETIDILQRKFVRLKPGYGSDQFEPFPPAAWELLKIWPGVKDGQLPIIRSAHATTEDGTNIMWEWHPPVLTIYRLWSAISQVPVEASLKRTNPPPRRLVRSRSTKFQIFLKQAKRVAEVDLSQRVRAWSVLRPAPEQTDGNTMPSPPADDGLESNRSQPWNHLLLDVETFLALERGPERDHIDFSDMTNQPGHISNKTLSYFNIAQDQAIVLDPHEGGTNWTSTFTPSQAQTSLPSRNNSTSLAVQNRNSRSGRTSPVSQGPLTRGRSQKSGRVPGCVGLANLGNTCYMNSALQCVRSVEELTKYFLAGEWEKELNKENILSHNGDVAAAYAYLLNEIYKDSSPGSIAPRQFKSTISRYAPQFSGFGQQDSQEFLGFLLDALQEDLSRVKKKPYIEKPDSTDDMVNNPEAIRRMADQVWDITKKRDDSVIADLFTGLYKSTVVCPECRKISITFDPFNNLTLPLPVDNPWAHKVKFFPLNDRPIDIRVELSKHASIKALKEFLSARTGVPVERLFGAEEWKGKFYKIYADLACASDEIGTNDNPFFYELEAKPTNWGAKLQKPQKLGVAVRSMVDEEEHNASASWDDELAEKLIVPVFHRRPFPTKTCPPHFIVLTPEEARSEDAIRRKVLEKVATFTKHSLFARIEESDGSDTTDPEIIGLGSSDAGSSSEGRVIAQSVKGEDDMVDVQMKDAHGAKDTTRSDPPATHRVCRKRPSWADPRKFLPPELQNLFELCVYSEAGAWLPTGMNGVAEDKEYPKLSLRIPPETMSSEDQLDNATNGTASNEESSSDEAPRRSAGKASFTRMNEESDEEETSAFKVCSKRRFQHSKIGLSQETKRHCTRIKLISNQSAPHRPKGRPTKGKNKQVYGKKHLKSARSQGKGGKKRQRQPKEKQQVFEAEESFNANEIGPDGGPLIRLREALVVDWSDRAYEELFVDSGPSSDTSLATWDSCETLPDPDLDRAQAARSRRRKNGVSLEACLDEFEREETLSEQDMWYCPRCKEHRRASKKFDLWKTPDILIIHFKRFSSSAYRNQKLDILVDFPLEDLDISSRVLQKEDGKQEVYDLIAVDCHWGSTTGGHYTAHAKNFIDGQWYTYNDSSVSRTSPDRIVDSSAYLLFYRRRSEEPLGGPRFRQILDRFVDHDSSDSEQPDSGEDQRLDEGFSQDGSSSALQGAGAIRPRAKAGDSSAMDYVLNSTENGWDSGDVKTTDDVFDANIPGDIQQSIEDDEAIDLTADATRSTGFQPLTNSNSWNFASLIENDGTDLENVPAGSPCDSGAASDEAQHDSSGVLSPHNTDFELEYPGMAHYELAAQPDMPSPPQYGEVTRDDIWAQKGTIHEVPPGGEAEEQSDDAAEIHLDESDKIKLG